ncbi:hypothetical protein [Novosphingobium sp. ZW T3_23]|uniref:hypothetical protein n=1 Tax=Novosphingobium sp. ZW T3_23 TaxID=3378084 RepID=UPI0038532E15
MNAPARLPAILEEGRSPSDWVSTLAERGLDVSERTLREKANRLGACHKLGRAMIITPDQLDTILRDKNECRSSLTSEEPNGGSKAGLNTSKRQSPTTTAAALEHLRKRARGSGAETKKRSGSVVTFSARKSPS